MRQPSIRCTRNPSFFRKSPLDPSIDDLLHKYRGLNKPRSSCTLGSVVELPKSPTNPERAIKLRQAREAFLSIGPAALPLPLPLVEEMDDACRYSETESMQSSNSTLTVTTIASGKNPINL